MPEPRLASRPTAATWPVLADLADRLAGLCPDPGLAARVHDAADGLRDDPGEGVVLDRLCAAYQLSPFERDIAVLAGLPEEHEDITQLARLLHPRGEPRMAWSTIAAALHLDAAGRRHLRAALETGPLHRHRLVTSDAPGPLPESGLRLTQGLWPVLRGHDHWPPGLRPRPVPPVPGPLLPPERLVRLLGRDRRVVVLTGSATRPPSELAGMVRAAADTAGLGVVVVGADSLSAEVEPTLSAHAVARAGVPVVVGRPSAVPLGEHPGPIVVCAEDATGVPLDDRPVIAVDLGDRPLGESVAMWAQLVPELDGGAGHLASVLRVDHLRAAGAVADARAAAASQDAPLDVAGVIRRARHRTGSDLPPSGRLVRPSSSWDDLVTTAGNGELLRSLVDRVRGQVRVLHDWGFAARATRGVRALFSGPPGTGKTLSAHIVATALELDLLVVDLSALVSKWLGETEKNISEVFAAAERAQAVLFFDEADAIFAKRTDASDAQGRWANLETAHLLARIDASEGLVVLATNLRGHIDDAFVRRLDVIVEFDEPGLDERRRLWEAHLPAAAPLAADVDPGQLAALYQITGGLIRNAALTAAYRAAAQDRAIDQGALLDAIAQEYQKAGRSFPGRPRVPAVLSQGGI